MQMADTLFGGMKLHRIKRQDAGKSESDSIENTGFRYVVVSGIEGILVTRFMEQRMCRMAVRSKQELTIDGDGNHFVGYIGFHHSESAFRRSDYETNGRLCSSSPVFEVFDISESDHWGRLTGRITGGHRGNKLPLWRISIWWWWSPPSLSIGITWRLERANLNLVADFIASFPAG
jgi:hypothetical protein